MNELHFKKFENELDNLISFMTCNTWEYHADPKPSPDQIVQAFNKAWYQDGRVTYWIGNLGKKIGLIIIHDIEDTIPLFDIRLAAGARGKGFGTKAVRRMIDYLFGLPDKKIRIEAYTRSDNIAMRKTLTNCGFVKEGYLRNAWENKDGSVSDSICYAIIRSDWESGVITPIKLYDVPF